MELLRNVTLFVLVGVDEGIVEVIEGVQFQPVRVIAIQFQRGLFGSLVEVVLVDQLFSEQVTGPEQLEVVEPVFFELVVH